MTIEASVETRVPLPQAWAWWTDFGPVGSEEMLDHGTGKTLRRIVAREGPRVVMEERAPLGGRASLLLMRHSVEVDEAARALFEKTSTFVARWRFEETPSGGTRITRALTLRGLGKLSPDALSKRFMERDLRAHVAAMEADVLPGAAKGNQG